MYPALWVSGGGIYDTGDISSVLYISLWDCMAYHGQKYICHRRADRIYFNCNWNYNAYKHTVNEINCVNDEEIKSILTRASDMFYDNMNNVLNILNDEVENG